MGPPSHAMGITRPGTCDAHCVAVPTDSRPGPLTLALSPQGLRPRQFCRDRESGGKASANPLLGGVAEGRGGFPRAHRRSPNPPRRYAAPLPRGDGRTPALASAKLSGSEPLRGEGMKLVGATPCGCPAPPVPSGEEKGVTRLYRVCGVLLGRPIIKHCSFLTNTP